MDGSSDDEILDTIKKNTDHDVLIAKDLMTIDIKDEIYIYKQKFMTKIIGILNLTLDSFSDGGMYYDINSAKKHVADMISQGADVIDLGLNQQGQVSVM